MARRNQEFQTIHSEGGLLPPDLLRRVLDPKENLEGMTPEAYGLPPGERFNEVITQSWNRLRKHWADFRSSAKNLPENEPGTALTNDKWSVPLLRELGFGLLPATTAPEINGRTYAINRFFGATPIHVIGCHLDLDRRAKGVRGAALANPHGLVQDFLNRSDAHLWAILSNGLRLRILRDSQAISRQSYLEFDVEAMFDGELFADFVLLWLVAHSTRFAVRDDNRPESCWLERWTKLAEEQGTRALGDLRQGVEKALETVGQGFVGHPKNTALRDALRTGRLTLTDFHGQLLRVVYRLIFLFVAEDRALDGQALLHPHDDSAPARSARERYAAHYSAARLRELAGAIRGSRHGDLWWQFNLLVGALSGDERFKAVRESLALPALGSFLWSPESTAALNAPSVTSVDGAELANADFLSTIRSLAFTRQGHALRPVDYKNLGAEELGGVYESLLALTPQISGDGTVFMFAEFVGNERKTSGSYYTPDSLVQCLLNSALEPVIAEAVKGKSGTDVEKAILDLKVCDPAVGSGHFLVAAAHRLAQHLARARAAAQGEGEPSPGFYQRSLRDVIGRCLYGVDINPMAAELCRVSLWLEALEPGKPLSFLDHHIRVGNSLLGTTPELIRGGLPDEAFAPIEGDERSVCAQLKRRNRAERAGFVQGDLLDWTAHGVAAGLTRITTEARKLEATPDDTADAIRHKADQFHRLVVSPEYKHVQLIADAWCATFVWGKTLTNLTTIVTTDTLKQLSTDFHALTEHQRQEVDRLSSQYQFFHWHLAFAEVFANGGFDCVLGNPPWERVKLQEKEWFALQRPDIAKAPNAAERARRIERLKDEDPAIFSAFQRAVRSANSASQFIAGSAGYPLCGGGDINLYAVFAEKMRKITGPGGRAGCVVPSGIATDDTTKQFFADLMELSSLVSLFDFENYGTFPDVDDRYRFCLITMGSGVRPTANEAIFVFFARTPADLTVDERRIRLSATDIRLFNPNTKTCPVFRTQRDYLLALALYRRNEVLLPESPTTHGGSHGVRITRMFDINKQRALFLTREEIIAGGGTVGGAYATLHSKRFVRLIEGKAFASYDHRAALTGIRLGGSTRTGTATDTTLEQHGDPSFTNDSYLYLPEEELDAWASGRLSRKFLVAAKDVTSSTNQRTVVAAILPDVSTDYSVRILMFPEPDAIHGACLAGLMNSFCLDYAVRQKLQGLHLADFISYQTPVPSRDRLVRKSDWFIPRVLELSYTAWDLRMFAKDCGFDSAPFRWDEERRFWIRAELDAAFFHLWSCPGFVDRLSS